MSVKRTDKGVQRIFIATPVGNPPAGSVYEYFKADGNLYMKNSAGVETQLNGGGESIFNTYRVLLSQNGANDPTIDATLENTLSGDIVWTRVDIGRYLGTLVGEFTNLKTFVLTQSIGASIEATTPESLHAGVNTINDIIIKTLNGLGSVSDGILVKSSIQILVYN